jgi:hypothetical protein
MVGVDGGGGGGRLAIVQWYQRSWSAGVRGGEEGILYRALKHDYL